MRYTCGFIIALLAVLVFTCSVGADRLPNQTPENQVFDIDTVIDVTGAVDQKSDLTWVISNKGSIPSGAIDEFETIADVSYKDSILSNGGELSENKNFAFDSRDQGEGLYSLDTGKVLTYAGTEGSHLAGEEEYTLSVAGNFDGLENDIRCVFSDDEEILPAFCNIVSAKSNLVNMNSAQISMKGQIRAVAEDTEIPAGLNYKIAVTPDENSGSTFAEGTVSTNFAGSIMEARDVDDYEEDSPLWNKTAGTNSWKDHTQVSGGIANFAKALEYQSGFSL